MYIKQAEKATQLPAQVISYRKGRKSQKVGWRAKTMAS